MGGVTVFKGGSTAGVIDISGGDGGTGGNLTLTAGGNITITNGSISLDGGEGGESHVVPRVGRADGRDSTGGNLTLTAGTSGTGNIVSIVSGAGSRRPFLNAGTLSLTQAGAFGSTAQFRFDASFTSLTLRATGMNIPQTVHAWMVGGTNRALSITTTGALTIGRDINTGTRALSLSGASIVLRGGGTTTRLNGGSIDLTGSISAPGGRGATGSGIRGGTGGTGGNLTLTATSGNITINGSFSAPGGAGGFGNSGGDGGNGGNLTLMATSGDITITGSIFAPGGAGGFGNSGGVGGTGGSLNLTAGGSISTGRISAPGGTGGGGNLGGRGGNGGILTLMASGRLTLYEDLNTGTGDLSLTGGSIVLVSDRTLTGGRFELRGAIDESGPLVRGTRKGGNDSLTINASRLLNLYSNGNLGSGHPHFTMHLRQYRFWCWHADSDSRHSLPHSDGQLLPTICGRSRQAPH